MSLGATDEQLDFPVIYASGREGCAIRELGDTPKDLGPLLDLIVEKVPPAAGDPDAPLLMHVATLDYDDYLGYVAIGRMRAGRSKVGDRVLLAHRDGKKEEFRVQKVLGFQGLKRFELAEATAGDIVAFTGMQDLNVGETITSIANPTILPLLKVDEPTITMHFSVNDGPFAGSEGKYVTSRNLRERLYREIKSNVALRVEETDDRRHVRGLGPRRAAPDRADRDDAARGLRAVVSQPQVILQNDDNGKPLEPYEEAVIDLDEAYPAPVIEELGRRRGGMQEMRPSAPGRMRLEYLIPARGLIGYRSQFLTDTRGTGVLYTQFANYGPQGPRHPHAPERRADLERGRRDQRLRPVLPAGARAAVHRPEHQGLRRHDHRPALARQRPRRQPEQGQEADQHPHHRRRREARARAAAASSRWSTRSSSSTTTSCRGHAAVDPAAQERSSTTTCASASRRSRPRRTTESAI